MNAALKSQLKPRQTFSRTESYIGVMIDDLIHKGMYNNNNLFKVQISNTVQ